MKAGGGAARSCACAAAVAAGLFLGTSPAAGQGHSGLGFGLRAGLGLDPDQAVLGAQVSLGKALHFFRFVPSVDVGLGDVTTFSFNGDLLLRLIVEESSVGLYAGGGPTVTRFDRDGDGPGPGEGAEDEWELGLTAVAGIQLPLIPGRATNLEARFGIGDAPDLRILFAIIF